MPFYPNVVFLCLPHFSGVASLVSFSESPCKDISHSDGHSVALQALSVPDIDSYIGLMHTLFTLEDIYGLTVSEADGEVCLKVNKDKGKDAAELLKMLCAWKEQADKLSSEEISREEYDRWRYYYPKYDTTQLWAKVPSQELSDALVDAFKDHLQSDK